MVEGVVELLAPKAQGKGIEIAAFVAPEVPARVIGDPDRLRQILVNLAGNAVKFTEAGGVGVIVEQGRDGVLSLAVHDTGPGITEDRVPSLFEEFEQGDGELSRRHGGTGLGLAITRRIVERMQGEIAVDSTVGAGAVFRVSLPMPEAAPPPAGERGFSGLRSLVLAQSPFEAPFIARRLREGGAEVALVETAVDALAKIATTRFGLVVVDCAFGEEVVRSVAEEARRAGIARKLILLSPFDRREFGSPAAAGFDGYLLKPVRAHSLFQQLAPLPGATASPQAAGPARRAARGAASRVLLAEDNEINALLALKSLEKLGAIADWAKTGEEALRAARLWARPHGHPHAGARRLRDDAPNQAARAGARRRTAPADRRAHRQSAQRRRDLGCGRLRRLLAKPFELAALEALLKDAGTPLARAC